MKLVKMMRLVKMMYVAKMLILVKMMKILCMMLTKKFQVTPAKSSIWPRTYKVWVLAEQWPAMDMK